MAVVSENKIKNIETFVTETYTADSGLSPITWSARVNLTFKPDIGIIKQVIFRHTVITAPTSPPILGIRSNITKDSDGILQLFSFPSSTNNTQTNWSSNKIFKPDYNVVMGGTANFEVVVNGENGFRSLPRPASDPRGAVSNVITCSIAILVQFIEYEK